MKHVRKELKKLPYDIQREKGLLNALDRQLTRVHGKRIPYAAPPAKNDEERLNEEYGLDIWGLESPETLRRLRNQQAAYIQEMQNRGAHLQHRLDMQLPISPWGFAFLFIKTLIRRRQNHNPRPQQVQKPQRPRHSHDRKRRLYKPNKDF